HIFWFDDVVAVQQFTFGRVARHVNVRVALVNDVRAEFHQPVDDPCDRIFVARNERGGQDDQVIFLDGDLTVFIVCHARQGCHGFVVCTSGHQHDVVVCVVVDVFEVDDGLCRDIEVSQFGGYAHVVDHRPADECDFSTVFDRRVENLLDPMHMRG